MSTQPTPGALSAAILINRGKAPVDKRVFPVEIENSMLIDREAVKPATAELLAALRNIADVAAKMSEQSGSAQAVFVRDEARAAIAKHEGRT